MTQKFIAPSVKGKEYMFDMARSIAVPKTSAKKIAERLTKLRYKLKSEKEIWDVHDNDWFYNQLITMEIRRLGKRITVYAYNG